MRLNFEPYFTHFPTPLQLIIAQSLSMNKSLTCTHTSLDNLTLSALITSPKGGTCLLKYFRKFAFSRAALMQMYRTMNAEN